jgi:hypothetical protein
MIDDGDEGRRMAMVMKESSMMVMKEEGWRW